MTSAPQPSIGGPKADAPVGGKGAIAWSATAAKRGREYAVAERATRAPAVKRRGYVGGIEAIDPALQNPFTESGIFATQGSNSNQFHLHD